MYGERVAAQAGAVGFAEPPCAALEEDQIAGVLHRRPWLVGSLLVLAAIAAVVAGAGRARGHASAGELAPGPWPADAPERVAAVAGFGLGAAEVVSDATPAHPGAIHVRRSRPAAARHATRRPARARDDRRRAVHRCRAGGHVPHMIEPPAAS